jgi:hypothetical protein
MTMASVSTAPGLDLFAAAWIEKWTANGGSVLLAPGGKASIGMPVYDKSRLTQIHRQRFPKTFKIAIANI